MSPEERKDDKQILYSQSYPIHPLPIKKTPFGLKFQKCAFREKAGPFFSRPLDSATPSLYLSSATLLPGTIPSNTAALVALSASVTRSFFSLT